MDSRMAEAANKLVGEAQGSLLAMVTNEIGYTWNCTGNVDKLRIEVGKLKSMLGRVQQRIKLATEKGDELLDGVLKWVNEADAHITKAQEFLQEEAQAKKTFFNLRMCVNLNTLRHYSKEAINKVSSLEQHQKDGAAFESDVSIPTPSLGPLVLNQRKDHNELDSQMSALENIIKAVEDESIQIIGIYGTGGVGKTTLAKEAAAMVKHLFDDVVFVTVSQPVNATHIKKKVQVAAKQIKRGEIILIILDDVWRELKLDEVGIPCGTNYSNCKILLTSRKSSVCVEMNAGSVICVDILPINEAWIFFKRVVGEKVETNARLKPVALKVAKGCGGLPLILQVVGKALKNERIMEWEAAFDRIQKHATSDIDPNVRLAFAHLKLSYDYLESKEVKSCFLLCSLFAEDCVISLETLAFYGVGLQFFKDLDSFEDARNRVRLAVKILKSSCLLLDAEDEFTTKMHDIVREVALLIASKDNNNFLVKAGKDLKEWEPRNGSMESYTGISLMENDICKLAVGHELKIPLLNIFLLQKNRKLSEISEEFILAVKKVRVIDFGYNNITSLPKSLKQLTRLRMLNLGGNRFLRDVSILGELTHLEILILNFTGIREIPQEIGKLVNLRLFHAEYCFGLSHIAPGVLSKLRWLEELHIGYYPVERGNHDDGLVEIVELSKLAFLKLYVPHIYLCPKGDYLKTLRGFYIQAGQGFVISQMILTPLTSRPKYLKNRLSTSSNMIPRDRKTMHLEKQHIDISDLLRVKKLTEVSNVIKLNIIGSNDYNILMPMMYCEGSGLKYIYVSKCHELLCLLDSRVLDEMQPFKPSKTYEGVKENRKFLSEVEHLELSDLSCLNAILRCPDQYISLIKLVNLVINNCPELEKLLTVSVAQGLVKLQKLEIYSCTSLKEVISDGDEETNIGAIVLPCLAEIVLIDLNNLESFFPRNAIIKYPSLVKVEIKNCVRMKNWGYGTHDTPNLQFINNTKANGSIVDGILLKNKEDELLREEVYQKIKAMKDLYLPDLNEMHQEILGKLLHHDSLPQQPKNEQLEKLKVFKNMLERFMAFLQMPKQSILANYGDKLGTYEKQIVNTINSYRRKPGASQQQGQALPPQQPHSQLTQVQSHDNQMSSHMQTGNMQGFIGGMQQNNMVSGRSLLQNAVSGPQQVNMNSMSSHSGMGTLHPYSNMNDRITVSAPGNESRAAVGEELVAMTKSRLQTRTSDTQDGANGVRKMKHSSAMPVDVLSPAIKRRRVETNHGLLEEIKEINRELIDTVVNISEEDVDPAAASEGGDGTVVKCSFSAVALGLKFKSQYASSQMSPIQPLRLLVPANYPSCSPIILNKLPAEARTQTQSRRGTRTRRNQEANMNTMPTRPRTRSQHKHDKEYEDLSTKTMSRFSISLRSLSQPMSLKEIAKTWNVCARAVMSDYAQQSGGGTS